jgi:hypothetical protein
LIREAIENGLTDKGPFLLQTNARNTERTQESDKKGEACFFPAISGFSKFHNLSWYSPQVA